MEPPKAGHDDERSETTVTRDGARRKRVTKFPLTLNAKISTDHRAKLDVMKAELGVSTDSDMVRAMIDGSFDTYVRRAGRRAGMDEATATAYRDEFEALRGEVSALTRQTQMLGHNVWQALRLARSPGYDVDMTFTKSMLDEARETIAQQVGAVKGFEARLAKRAL